MRIRTNIDLARASRTPGRHNAGPGLYLVVGSDKQSRRWAFRFTKPSTGRVTEVGLGTADLCTLAEARDKAYECRRAVASGHDPVEQKRDPRTQITFCDLATEYIAAKEAGWRSQSHRATIRLLLLRHSHSVAWGLRILQPTT